LLHSAHLHCIAAYAVHLRLITDGCSYMKSACYVSTDFCIYNSEKNNCLLRSLYTHSVPVMQNATLV